MHVRVCGGVHVCVCVDGCVGVGACVRACMHACLCVRVCVEARGCMYVICVCVIVCMYVRVCVLSVCDCVCVCVCVCVAHACQTFTRIQWRHGTTDREGETRGEKSEGAGEVTALTVLSKHGVHLGKGLEWGGPGPPALGRQAKPSSVRCMEVGRRKHIVRERAGYREGNYIHSTCPGLI